MSQSNISSFAEENRLFTVSVELHSRDKILGYLRILGLWDFERSIIFCNCLNFSLLNMVVVSA